MNQVVKLQAFLGGKLPISFETTLKNVVTFEID